MRLLKSAGKLSAPGDPEFLIGPEEMTFDGPHRQMHVVGDLLVPAAGGCLPGNGKLS
jgi:hypothetical protein